MWYLDDQKWVTIVYQLPEELDLRLEQASSVFRIPEEAILIQALKEFFEKHGIRRMREVA
ncbi:MAG: hypothetical protein HY710_02940 [Candidatus Latescibacteria bacterium]|nr:hypothetical protein [Candidatus Latescibacterota bacterium]